MPKIVTFFLLFLTFGAYAQELNCTVAINASQVQVSNTQVFTTLENAVFEYMNKTQWTSTAYKKHEKINCSIMINILEVPAANQYKGSLQLQVSRPVYNTTYTTPVLSFNDNDINFIYQEYQPLVYNENSYTTNLVSILTYYAYTILGFEADSFSLNGGTEFFKLAENVVNISQQDGGKGWKKNDGNNTRYTLNENILSPVYDQFRQTMYDYHRNGLDIMVDKKREGKLAIRDAIVDLEAVYNYRSNAFLIRVFMDTKNEEIVDVFADGPRIETTQLREVLIKIFPSLDASWKKIKI